LRRAPRPATRSKRSRSPATTPPPRRRGSADPQKIRDALASIDITSGPASFVPGGEVKFDSTGQNVKAQVAIQQWQDGKIVTIDPPSAAVGKLIPLR